VIVLGGIVFRWILNGIYAGLLIAFTPWMMWQTWRTGKYREGWSEKLWGRLPKRTADRPCVWFHAVSVGEMQLLRPLIQEFAQRWPGWEIVISSTTITGRKLARESYPQYSTFYMPFDFSWAISRAFQRLRPNLIVLAELELWPNLLTLAQQHEIEVAIVNGRLSERSFKGYQKIRFLTRSMLSKVNCIAAQNDTYAERFITLGANRKVVQTTGSIKFDGANADRNHAEVVSRRIWAGLSVHDQVWFVGSTQDPEEAMALEIFLRQRIRFPKLKLIVVPRHAERFDSVAGLLEKSALRVIRRSNHSSSTRGEWDILLIDTIGELRWWWGVADLATVGGSFGTRGGQNMIEPCAYGACVSFGPNTRNFRDIVDELLRLNAAIELADSAALERWVEANLEEPSSAADQGRIAADWVATHLGATRRTADLLAHSVELQHRAQTLPFRQREAA
jgi:3-deoxy-D-manno-octulosonic-acid transferase